MAVFTKQFKDHVTTTGRPQPISTEDSQAEVTPGDMTTKLYESILGEVWVLEFSWVNSENHTLPSTCLLSRDIDIIELAETHITSSNEINFDGYSWFGNNETLLHANSKCGSGRIFLMK